MAWDQSTLEKWIELWLGTRYGRRSRVEVTTQCQELGVTVVLLDVQRWGGAGIAMYSFLAVYHHAKMCGGYVEATQYRDANDSRRDSPDDRLVAILSVKQTDKESYSVVAETIDGLKMSVDVTIKRDASNP